MTCRCSSTRSRPEVWQLRVLEGTVLLAPFLVALIVLLIVRWVLASLANGTSAIDTALQLTTALVLVLIYFATQQQVIRLASAGATITIQTKQMTIDEARDLFDRIEAAKNARYIAVRPAQ